MKDKIFGVLQRVGRSFMLPIAILPVAGLFLGIGGSFTNANMIEAYGLSGILGEGTFLYAILSVLNKCGDIVFANLPILFAMGVAIGMAKKEKEVAALAAAIAFFIMHSAIGAMLTVTNAAATLPNGSISSVVGIESLQMGVFGGIIVGLGVAALHNRFYKIELPQVLSFFGGTRFVPIICSIVYLIVGIVMFYIWPIIQQGIYAVGDVVRSSGYAGTLIYGIMERALIPFGLHHVFYLPFWQTAVGGTATIDGSLIEGAQNIFFAQLASPNTTIFDVEATRFMAGKFPLMIFGLPGAALAMYKTAKPEKKQIAGGLLLSAALTSMLTGITEPLEFTFLFIAPILYAIHCFFAGCAYMLMHIFKVGVGMTFSGGLIDLTLFGIMQGNAKTNWIWVVIIGIAYFVVYFLVFTLLIKKFNFKTPGREDDDVETKLYTRADVNAAKAGGAAGAATSGVDAVSQLICQGLGGKKNISDVDCCATRLRCTVVDSSKVQDALLKQSGAAGVIHKGLGVQVIYGPKVTVIKSNLEDYLASPASDVEAPVPTPPAPEPEQQKTESKAQTINKKEEVFSSYVEGRMADISEAPDEAFAGKLMGDGIVMFPKGNIVYAPADATIETVFPTKHAIGLKTKEGTEILLHVGIDTVKLDGKGFTVFVNDGDTVKKGDKLMEVDLNYIAENAASTAIPMVFTNLEEGQEIVWKYKDKTEYQANEDIIIIK
ncbi:PTS transporter subunit IIABC [Clostridium sp. MD294]|uniref:PTS transporter subunit IIABC n=1 Tax=Clostridium sp. MD294 TaxID=97138 RepID=UPI0002C9EC55|nr:PTS transporter subunit IIABC [Clostridium sp. MD294]NDO45610.1 PTS glucose transporter subunit IIA [Clostridium sp. MD294]USF30736.1 PTS system glucose-specific EIICBA component [Clostridium sp. MD294]